MKARSMAFGAVYSAIAIILLSLSAFISDDLFLLMASSLPLSMVSDQFGKRVGIASYATIAILTFLIFPMRISILGFIFIFGPYAVFKGLFNRKRIFNIIFHFMLLFGLSAVAYAIISYTLRINLTKYTAFAIVLLVISLILYERFVEYFSKWYLSFFSRHMKGA